jgi:L-amino acid N-acyltransferase YncA
LLTATALELIVRDLRPDDWVEVAAIYRDGMRGGMATFETEVPDWDAWHEAHPLRVVAEEDERVIGWAAFSPVSSRWAYRGVAESSVYVARDRHGKGIGRTLMEALIERSERAGIWTLQTSIFPENEASLKLHRAVGFRVVGVRKRIGKRDGLWRDTVLMERRSEVIV